ncbi:MAG: outer membrane beta-barrel protein, partial [Leptospiraceae bacterium]|nr:outer membrane beta-barrel protein [Leptospiraceae bacterium]
MKVKVNQILTIIIIYTLSIFSVSVLAQDLSSEPKIDTVKEMIQKEYEKKWYNQVNFSGFVDVYYNYTMNNSQGAQVNHAGTMHKYNKQFAVSSVELDIEKVPEKKSPWGFRIDFQNGQNNAFQENSSYVSNSIFNMNMLQQAYVSLYFPIYKGIQFDMGKMTSHAEVDAIESKDNYTYTMGYLSYNIPFIATGARAKATLSDSWAFTLYFYDNVTGTGYINYNKRNTNAQEFLADTNQHYYNVGSTKAQTVGTKLEGDVVKEKVSMSWNTIYGNEYANGRVDNQTYYYNQIANAPTPSSPGYKIKYDYYFINNIYFTFHLLERLSF